MRLAAEILTTAAFLSLLFDAMVAFAACHAWSSGDRQRLAELTCNRNWGVKILQIPLLAISVLYLLWT